MIKSNKLIFLNHSSVLVKSEKTSVLCDPWFKGSAFNNGWRLLYDNSHDINNIEFDYIWISHEHPDHFSIPTLNDLVRSQRFLYQRTSDQKVKNWLARKEHLIMELEDATEYQIGDIAIKTFVSDGYDSASLFRFTNGELFLNLNDLRPELSEVSLKIKKSVRKKINLISMQFSYANWAGNYNDSFIPLHQQNTVIERICNVYYTFRPEKIMLFASFIFCSHEENFFWNNKFWLSYVVEKLQSRGIPLIVPEPNQVIEFNKLGEKKFLKENVRAIKYWENKDKFKRVYSYTNKDITFNDIQFSYGKWFDQLWQLNKEAFFSSVKNSDFKLRVKISDKNYVLEISLFKKDIIISRFSDYDCLISSDTLIFLFENRFGRGTVTINSKIQFNYEFAHRFFIFFFISYANNIGRFFDSKELTAQDLYSVGDTSVMESIFRACTTSRGNFQRDLEYFR